MPVKHMVMPWWLQAVDDVVISDGAARLGDVLDAGLEGALHVVAEGEEGVGADSYVVQLGDPFFLFFTGQHFRLDLERLLPDALRQDVLIFVRGIHVNGVVPIGAADAVHELETQHLGMLPQPPVVRLVACQTGAVDAALLAGAHADGLTVLDVADGVGLGVFQGDEADDQVNALRSPAGPCSR